MAEDQDYHAVSAEEHQGDPFADSPEHVHEFDHDLHSPRFSDEDDENNHSPGHPRDPSYSGRQTPQLSPPLAASQPPSRSPSPSLKKAATFTVIEPPSDRLVRSFKSRFQLHRLLFENFIRWLSAALLLLLTYVSLRVFENIGNTTSSGKNIFNAISTILNIALALNFFGSLKELAKILRWRVLAEKPHNIYEVDLILGAESLTNCTKLAYKYFETAWEEVFGRNKVVNQLWKNKAYRRVSYTFGYLPPPIQSGRAPERKNWGKIKSALWSFAKVSSWLLTNIAAQGAIAMISLTYSTEAGGPLVPAPIGPTWSSDLSRFYPLAMRSNNPSQPLIAEQFSAHQLGDIGTVFQGEPIHTVTWAKTSTHSQKYFLVHDDDGKPKRWVYRYFNYDAEDYFKYAYSVPTQRTISVHWDGCYQYPVTKGAKGVGSNDQIHFQNTTSNQNIQLEIDLSGNETTTYMYPNAFFAQCTDGDRRCARMQAFQKPTKHDASYLFQCQIHVSEVTNTDPKYPEQALDDREAHIAAAAVGLSGYGSTEDVFTATGKNTMVQFERYSLDSHWSLAGASSDDAGRLMAEFTIASLAAMAEFNPKKHQIAPSVVQGVKLSVRWEYVRILLPLIAGVHFLFFVMAVFASNPYVVRDDSNLATAQVLRPLISGIGPAGMGSYLKGREIADMVHLEVLNGEPVVYGTKRTAEGEKYGMISGKDADTFELHFGPESEMMPRGTGDMRHEDGWYL